VTPPSVKPAGMAARATAVIIDALFAFFVLGLLVAVVTRQTYHSSSNVGFNLHGGPAFFWALLSLAYWTVCERLWGMTIGKRLFSIRVVGPEGGNPTWGQSLTRNLLRVVDAFPYLIPYLVGFVAAEGNDERQRIGDRVAGTRVSG
jgi:uncharacterized RDD family membrane protein YckC